MGEISENRDEPVELGSRAVFESVFESDEVLRSLFESQQEAIGTLRWWMRGYIYQGLDMKKYHGASLYILRRHNPYPNDTV